jgi:polysaccharide export outer membrane protein
VNTFNDSPGPGMRNRIKSSVFFLIWAPALIALSGCAGGPDSLFDGELISGRYAAAPEPEPAPAPAPAGENGVWETSSLPTVYEVDLPIDLGDGPYLLDTGDRLRIFVYGQPNLSRSYTVDQEGRITVPLIGPVDARGRTTANLEYVITSRLGAEYVRDPQVTVDIQQNRPFFIFGEVKTGGQYPYVSGMTVETAIAIAGGYSDRASDRTFRVTRRGGGYVEQVDVPADFPIRPGDTVYVYERFF